MCNNIISLMYEVMWCGCIKEQPNLLNPHSCQACISFTGKDALTELIQIYLLPPLERAEIKGAMLSIEVVVLQSRVQLSSKMINLCLSNCPPALHLIQFLFMLAVVTLPPGLVQ